jgi:lipid-A-disaccharide synthase
MMRVMVIAGEASGDMYGAELVRRLREKREDVQFFGTGGKCMEGAGVDILFRPSLDIVGGVEAISLLPKAFLSFKKAVSYLTEAEPDLLLLIDFAEFNLHLLKKAHSLKIKSVWFFPPTAWAWRPKRAEVVARCADLVISCLRFEADFYRKHGANTIFVGHPLLDIVKPKEKLCFDGRPIIGLLPGSRKCEVKRMLPAMVDAIKLLSFRFPKLHTLLLLAPTIEKRMVEPYLSNISCTIVEEERYSAMAVSDLLLVTSGTATLEAAILKRPMIVLYKIHPLSFLLARFLVKTRYISLCNIIAEKGVVPELIQRKVSSDVIAEEAEDILNCIDRRKEIERGLDSVVRKIYPEGAIKRSADAILSSFLNNK